MAISTSVSTRSEASGRVDLALDFGLDGGDFLETRAALSSLGGVTVGEPLVKQPFKVVWVNEVPLASGIREGAMLVRIGKVWKGEISDG